MSRQTGEIYPTEKYARVKDRLVMELSWHNPPWCLQSKCDKGMLSKGTEDDLAVVLWDKKETLSSQTDWVERNKPTHCSLNRLQGQWGALFLCVICADAVVQISVVLSLHCAELCKCLGADLRHSNQSCTWETLLSSPPTILKCWLNFKFFCRKKKEIQKMLNSNIIQPFLTFCCAKRIYPVNSLGGLTTQAFSVLCLYHWM